MQQRKENSGLELHLRALVCVFIPFLLAAGCIGTDQGAPVEGTGWILAGYQGNGTLVPVLAGTEITLSFREKGQLDGRSGCNHYFATYETKGNTITVTQAGSTEMYCGAPGVMDQEAAYLALLTGVKAYLSKGDRLIFYDRNGMEILSFAKDVPPAPQPLTGTLWTLESVSTGDSVSSVISGTTITAVFTDDGNVTGSAGCNRFFARYTLTGESLVFTGTGSTKMMCHGQGVMTREQEFLERLSETRKYTITGNELVFLDGNGDRLLAFRTTV